MRKHRVTQCRHFTGVQSTTCGAAVRYAQFADLPCWGDGPCDAYAPRSSAEVEAEEAEFKALLEEAVARDARGECLHCGVQIERRVQVGRCVYAEPCGHRLGQGKA